MKQSIDLYAFRRAFEKMRPDNFSYEGLEILFDHLEEMEQSGADEMELDVIAICCDFSEDHWTDIAENYSIDLSDCDDEDEKIEAVKDWLDYRTQYCGMTTDGAIIYCSAF